MNPGSSEFSEPNPYRVQAPIDGRTKRKFPVCIMMVALECAGRSVYMLLSRHISSACWARLGSTSGNHRPLCPCWLNLNGDFSNLRPLPPLPEVSFPLSAVNRG